jgi:hypothetical protein
VKGSLVLAGLFVCSVFCASRAESLSPEKEEQLRSVLEGWIGMSDVSQSAAAGIVGSQPPKCGTPAFLTIKNMMQYASLNTQQLYETFAKQRFNSQCPDTIGSPAGHFLVHYAKQGIHAPYQADVDDNSNGIPDYIDRTAMILDSVWAFEVDTLGFTPPPADGFYTSGGDDRYDMYVLDIPTATGYQNIYGGTYEDELFKVGTKWKATSFIILDNDYANITVYRTRPLDALRVTAAHEFFHAIQFGYDPNESNMHTPNGDVRTHWLEMSSVWMEEQNYDAINDYYGYLGFFFGNPHLSLRTCDIDPPPGEFFQYAAVTWPLYLSQKYGRQIVKTIWDSCAVIYGPNVFENAFKDAIAEESDGGSDFPSALGEFALWNYFTGSRAIDGIGYSEAASYPVIPENWDNGTTVTPYIQTFQTLPRIDYYPGDDDFQSWPDYLAANYVRVIPVGLDSLRFRLDGEQHRTQGNVDFIWNVRAAKVNFQVGEKSVEIDPVNHPNIEQFTIRELGASSEVILSIAPYAETDYKYIHQDVKYRLTIPDSTEYAQGTVFHDPFPNPLSLSQNRSVKFKVQTDATSEDEIHLEVFTVAGEKVYGRTIPVKTARVGQDIFIDWNGRNESNAEVASGLYLAYVRVGSESEVFKIAVIE